MIASYYVNNDKVQSNMVFGGTHPDVIELPEAAKSKLAVEDIDFLTKHTNRKPTLGAHKWYILNHAETLSPQSQNKLLKTLEESQNGVRFILNASSLSSILSTIQSRCRIVKINPFSENEFQEAFWSEDKEVPSLVLSVAQGSLTRLDNFLQNPAHLEVFKTTLNALSLLTSSKAVLDCVVALTNTKADISEIIDYMEMIFRDCMVWDLGQRDLIALKESKDKIEQLANLYSALACEKILSFLLKVRRRKEFNANANSLLDNLIFTIAEYRIKYST